ncbi:protein kinase [Streptomyces sp. NBC_01443]|uniref:protein kinase domain-containing protein n=1 Tax=Streptomyces sp. NBC_01443 TaxID=2903868 RepID=UPI002251AF8B|nr:protein kinase [Streptomyces sp. NBC_01443]MCX4627792.1 protein kinase [Streptomyces sp. NBC_01443]
MSGGFAVRVGDELAGRYRLEQRLGQGGMGEVWRGHDLMLDRSVAVKVLLEAATNDEVVARFRREATIGARLQHPGITVVHDVGQQDGRLFIVMELLAGEDLATALARDGAPAVDLAVDLAAQTAEALAVAHGQAVVHRDLKPGNLFLLPGRRIKICDFGIAHSADATAGWTVTGRIIGTPAYMAPEQWRGERVGARCDLYALGCVLYALLSGAPPFGQTEGPYVLMHRHVAEAPLPLREAGTPVPAELDRLVLALLAKNPADRPESAEVVGKALRELRGLRGGENGGGPVPESTLPDPAPAPAPGQGPGTGPSAGAGQGPGSGSEGGAGQAPGPGPKGGAGQAPGSDPGAGAEQAPVPGSGAPAAPEPASGSGGGRAAGAVSERAAGAVSEQAAGVEAERAAGVEAEQADGVEAEQADGAGAAPVAAEGVASGVREFVRGLLVEAEDALRELPGGGDARVEVLAVAADAAARFDADLAARLLADAESAAWADGEGDGARVARLLTALARATSGQAPARARRLLTEAQQALFTVPGSKREGPLRALAEELIKVAPEQASQIAGYHLSGRPAPGGLRARIEAALAAERPEEAEYRLTRIQDPGQRAATTYDLVVALAPRDLPAAMRLSERIGSAGGRLLVLCQLAQDRAAAGDPVGASHALAHAEEELPRVLEERAAWLREEADRLAGQSQPVEAERLRNRAAGLLRGRVEASADEKAGHALTTLEAARARVAEGTREPLDRVRAQARADRARSLPEPAQRALALAGTARECLATGRVPWLPEAAADAGAPPPPGTTALGGPFTGPAVAPATYARLRGGGPEAPPLLQQAAPGSQVWQTGARPDALYAAGAYVVWRSGPEVGCVRADSGMTGWTAYADEGAVAPPLPGSGRVLVSCVADAATVYVKVRREGEPGVRLLAREPRNGRVRWWRDLPQERPLRSAGPVLVHGAPGDLTALRAATGETLWQRTLRDTTTRSSAAAADRLVLADDREYQALDLSSGRQVWSRRRDRPAGRTVHGQPVHILDVDHLLALDRDTGREMWRFRLGAPAERLLVERSTVYAAANRPEQGGDVVFAFSAVNGELYWQRSLTRHEGTACAVELLGFRPWGVYVSVPRGGRRGMLSRTTGPSIAVLDRETGKPRRHWAQPGLGEGDTLLIGDQLVVSRPELSAYALP